MKKQIFAHGSAKIIWNTEKAVNAEEQALILERIARTAARCGESKQNRTHLK